MAYFTTRERRALGYVDERAQTKQRESVRDDFAPRRGATNTEIGPLIQQMRDAAVEKIEAVIAELRHQREAILGEGARVRHEIIAYAKLNQVTMDSTRVISGSLANLVNAADAPAISELVEAVSDKEAVPDKKAVSDKEADKD